MGSLIHDDCRVQVLAPFGKDATLVREVLEKSGIPVAIVDDAEAIARLVGNGSGAAIITEEALTDATIELLSRSIGAQPAWSDFPIIVLTGSGASTPWTEMMVRSRAPMGNITLIERPLRPATLIAVCVRPSVPACGSTKFAIISKNGGAQKRSYAALTRNSNHSSKSARWPCAGFLPVSCVCRTKSVDASRVNCTTDLASGWRQPKSTSTWH